MPRATVAVALPPEESEAVLAELHAAGFGTVTIGGPEDLQSIVDDELPVGLAILDADRDGGAAIAPLGQLRAQGWTIPVLYVGSPGATERIQTAPTGDNDEVLTVPTSAESVRWRVEAMLIRAQVSPEAGGDPVLTTGAVDVTWTTRSPILAVFNPKGGVGKTTIATNLAAALQVRKGRRVLLVDADSVTGHVTLSLGMDGGRTIADSWRDEADGGPAESILDIAAVHESGVRVAALTSSPLALPHLKAERVADALLEARRGVNAVIVDLHPSYSEVNLAIFAIADRILVPVTPDLPAIRAAVQLTEVATELGVRDRLAMIVNRANSGISVADMERTAGMTSLAEIRSAGLLFVRAANAGRTVIDLFPKEKVTEDFDELADRLLGSDSQAERSPVRGPELRSLFGGLFGRKETVGA